MLRKYEVCMLLDPDLDQNGIEGETSGISEIMSSNGASVVRKELWGRRGLMYPIKKKKEGYYYLFYLEAEPETLKKIQDQLKHRQTVLRTLIMARKEIPEA
ncbi:MAG: 30S ribosomal protein S6 [Candidatus Omnitrophica bacterium]|nr:30S ribosomal protein S6 [Candidatus Omnitrophota bacterium]